MRTVVFSSVGKNQGKIIKTAKLWPWRRCVCDGSCGENRTDEGVLFFRELSRQPINV
jgi:hypothetical protein